MASRDIGTVVGVGLAVGLGMTTAEHLLGEVAALMLAAIAVVALIAVLRRC